MEVQYENHMGNMGKLEDALKKTGYEIWEIDGNRYMGLYIAGVL